MSRLTGTDAKGLMEAYAEVYAPQELTEEQIWEEVETWVNSLLEEGYDLSEYTWEEMYNTYLNEAIGQPGSAGNVDWMDKRTGQVRSGYKSSSDGKLYRNYNDALAAHNSRLKMGQEFRNQVLRAAGGGTIRSRSDSNAAAAPAASRGSGAPAASRGGAQTVAAAGGKGGTVTVGTKYAATSGGQKGSVSYDASGKRTFTADKPATSTTPATAKQAPTPKPSLASGNDELKRMQAASMMRQQGRNLPSGKIPVGSDLAPKAATTSQATTAASSTSPSASTGSTLSPGNVAKQAAASKQSEVRPGGAGSNKPWMKEEYDAFDLVLEYLTSEGHVETLEEALYVMMELDTETIQDICEAKYGTAAGRKKLAKKIRKGEEIGKSGPGTGFEEVKKAAKKGGARDPEAVAAAAMWKTYGGKKGKKTQKEGGW